ncbi:MAG: DUF1788 domain-containing protein [Anaerolineae bacterium]|nr:DUF1788 domain-containing protein [Anaerolineae bacterium]
MRSLQAKFEQLEDLLVNHRQTLAQNTGVPFVRLVYQPDEENECRRLYETLARALAQRHVAVNTVSCRGAIFVHYEARGRLDQLFELEQTDPARLQAGMARHARQELEQRLEQAILSLNGDGIIFVVDAAFVYPYFQLDSVLDAITNRVIPPMALVVFYPGEVNVDGQLMFLGQRPSGYYRTRDLI